MVLNFWSFPRYFNSETIISEFVKFFQKMWFNFIHFTVGYFNEFERFRNFKQTTCEDHEAFIAMILTLLKLINYTVNEIKDVRELSWMSHGVMRFRFLLNFLFISVFFDILASLSISRVFSSSISGRWKSSCSDIPRTIINLII